MNTKAIFSDIAKVLSPILSLIIVVGIGVYASVRAQALGGAFPFSCFEGVEACLSFPVEARWFYGFVLLVLIPLIVYQMYVQSKQQRETEELLKATRDMVDTAPPKQLLRYTNERYTHSRMAIDALNRLENAEDQDVAYTIRVILLNMLEVASYWDTHEVESSLFAYRANVMLLYPCEAFDSVADRKTLLEELRFADRNAVAAEGGCGHFQLYARTAAVLNTSAGLGSEKPDSSIRPLILGLDAPSEHGAQPERIMPGAPTCLFRGKPQYIADTAAIPDILKSDAYFNSLRSEIEAYYRDDGNARSILSIPLVALQRESEDAWEPGNPPYIGVVNIFRDAPKLLGGARAADQYSALMGPLLDALAESVDYALANDVELHTQ